jgi:hypothetical protein
MTAASKPLTFSVPGFALSSVANIFIFTILLVACMIFLCNHKRTEFGKPHAYREPMCASENCQWCGKPCAYCLYIRRTGSLFCTVEGESGLSATSHVPSSSVNCHLSSRRMEMTISCCYLQHIRRSRFPVSEDNC